MVFDGCLLDPNSKSSYYSHYILVGFLKTTTKFWKQVHIKSLLREREAHRWVAHAYAHQSYGHTIIVRKAFELSFFIAFTTQISIIIQQKFIYILILLYFTSHFARQPVQFDNANALESFRNTLFFFGIFSEAQLLVKSASKRAWKHLKPFQWDFKLILLGLF